MKRDLSSCWEITPQNRYLAGLIGWVVATVMFAAPQRFPLLEATVLSHSALDQAVPFLPWTVWIYISYYFIIITGYLIAQDFKNINLFKKSFFLMQGASVVFFFVYPTTFPRDEFPLPTDLGPWTHWTWTTLRTIDLPSNCLPSLHVATSYLVAFMMRHESKTKGWIYFVWATLIAASTITTKQHFAIDVFAGFGVAAFCHWVIRRRKKTSPSS